MDRRPHCWNCGSEWSETHPCPALADAEREED